MLHHGHMLVGRRMENENRAEALKNLIHPMLVEYIGDQRHNLTAITEVDQFLLNLENLHLTAFNEQKSLRAIGGDLPAEFAPNTAAGARYHHHPILHETAGVFFPF